MSFRLAAYAVCIEDGRVLLARYVSPAGESSWTLPGGRVEHGEDPFDAVTREVAEETGCDAVVERLLGVDSRVRRGAFRRPATSLPLRWVVLSSTEAGTTAYCRLFRNASTASLNRAGWSTLHMCPASGITTFCAPGILAAT
jgi:ADP-ribose pyrophosphatase YjhB (NUDIX family)